MKNFYYFLFFIPVFTFSQYRISGNIENSQGNPMDYAEVVLKHQNTGELKNTISDFEGFFELENLKKGKYQLTIFYFSEKIHEQELLIDSNLDLKKLQLKSEINLEAVDITSKPKLKKKLGKYVLTNISASKFSKNKSTFEFLNTVPILETSHNNSSLKIRNRGDATILINGKNVGSNDVALNMIKSIPASEIKRIEIIKNPGSEYSASNKNGIINVILKGKDYEGLKGSVSLSSYQSFYNSQQFRSFLSYAKNKIYLTSGVALRNSKSRLDAINSYKNYEANLETEILNSEINKEKRINPYLNFEYQFSKEEQIGVQFNAVFSDKNSKNHTENIFRNVNEIAIDSVSTSEILRENPNFLQLFGNLNYYKKTDTLGSNLRIDFSSFYKKEDEKSYNNFNYASDVFDSFIQNPAIEISILNFKTDYNKVFQNDAILKYGVLGNYSKINNDFFFGNFENPIYVSDPKQSNKFDYKEYTISAYASYETVISKKIEGGFGLRLEHFSSEGETETVKNEVNIENTYLFPSLFLLYDPSDNHEFTLDLVSNIMRAPYRNLNPFLEYTSPNSYRISNPNLKPILSYEALLNYTFFDDFSFDFEYIHDQDLFNDFDVVLPNNDIEILTDNYGNSNSYYLGFMYSNTFFHGNWNVSTTTEFTYDNTNGAYNGINLDYENKNFTFNLRNFVNLSKKNDLQFSCDYGFTSTSTNIFGERNALHSLKVTLSRTFNNFSVNIGAYDLAREDLILKEDRGTYSFYKKKNYYKTAYINLRYDFGKKKVKKIYNKKIEGERLK
ncbi:TonB-dependent receptor [Aureivirga sp. CE67]|uniref:TonB-dependent receptor n=1 Tax=Aureivirga sp. CE67 TaxID=1788983 RepID=UPI0018C93AA9|nr:TonB-dependent receptor [Aureivirga sp. CE67]